MITWAATLQVDGGPVQPSPSYCRYAGSFLRRPRTLALWAGCISPKWHTIRADSCRMHPFSLQTRNASFPFSRLLSSDWPGKPLTCLKSSPSLSARSPQKCIRMAGFLHDSIAQRHRSFVISRQETTHAHRMFAMLCDQLQASP